MKKRFIILSLILVLSMPMLSLAKTDGMKVQSSSDRTQAVKYINKFIDNTSLVNEFDLTTSLHAKVKVKGQPIQEIKGLGRIKMKKGYETEVDISKIAASMVGTIEFGGQKAKGSFYIKDGYVYQNVMGKKTKKALDVPPEKLMMFGQYKGFDIKTSWLKSVKVKKYNRGRNVSITAELNLKNVQQFIKNDPNLKELFKENDKVDLSSIKKFNISYHIKNNVPYQSAMYVKVNAPEGSGSSFFKINYNKINNIGKISYPADLESYKLEEE